MNKKHTPFWDGYNAWFNRKGVINNPYPTVSPIDDPDNKSDHQKWHSGWLKADNGNNP